MKNIHFLGIAGQMMSGLAAIAKSRGYEVTGSDENAYPPATTTLDHAGISFISGHDPKNLGNCDTVVLGNHIRENNLELQAALSRKLDIISYPQFIDRMFAEAHEQVVIAGTHGKSTTTSLVGWILDQAGVDPTVLIGAVAQNFENSFRKGEGEIVVIEGDEYSSSCLDSSPKFAYYHPSIGVITSVELDHMDLYANLDLQYDVFIKFARSIKPHGTLLVCADSVEISRLGTFSASIETYGFNSGVDWSAGNIKYESNGTRFDITRKGNYVGTLFTPLAGKHNVLNSLVAAVIALRYGVTIESIQKALDGFKGVGKRFDIKGEFNGVLIVEDYAHHPTAIRATLEAAKARYPHRKLWCVYEPHTYSRIKGLLDKFSDAFTPADEVIISDIFPAREKALEGLVHSRDLVAVAENQSPRIHYLAKPAEILAYLENAVKPGDVVLFMAVGTMEGIAQKLGASLEAKMV